MCQGSVFSGHHHILWVQQPLPGLARRASDIDTPVHHQLPLRTGLDEATGATAASGLNASGEQCLHIRPDDHPAGVAGTTGVDQRITLHPHRTGIAHTGVLAQQVATDPHLATHCTRYIQPAAGCQPDGVAKHIDLATSGSTARRIQRAGHRHLAGIAIQHDGAAFVAHAGRLHQPAGVDDVAHGRIGGLGAHQHPPALGDDAPGVVDDRPAVGGQGLDAVAHLERQQAVAMQVQRKGGATGQHHLAQLGGDHPVVAHRLAGQHRIATLHGVDLPLVDQRRTRLGRPRELVAARQEVFVGDALRGAQEALRRDLPALAHEHAIGVEQPDLAVGQQRAVDQRGLLAGHTVECDGRSVGLDELHRLPRADRELAPVDDGLVRLLGDGGDAGAVLDAGTAGHHRGIEWLLCPSRRGGEQCCAGSASPARDLPTQTGPEPPGQARSKA